MSFQNEKKTPDGKIKKFKSRLCAKEFAKKEGVNYYDTFFPTTKFDSIRVLLSMRIQHNYIIQSDVKIAFLFGDLKKEIYMIPLIGVNIDPYLQIKEILVWTETGSTLLEPQVRYIHEEVRLRPK